MSTKSILTVGALLLLTTFAPAWAADGLQPLPSGFLSEPAQGEPLDVALAFLQTHHGELGLTAGDFADHVVSDLYVSRHTGVTHVYLQQRLDGVTVHNGILTVNVMPDGRILNVASNWVGDLAGKVGLRSPRLAPEQAIDRAATHFGLSRSEPYTLLDNHGGAAQEMVFASAGLSSEDIPVRLVYQAGMDGSVRLAWNVRLRMLDGQNWWNVRIDADTGQILDQNDWIANDSYLVVPLPKNDPGEQLPIVVNDPADLTASPFGWHDTNGVAGPEFTDTRGNNVLAQEDTDANNSGGSRPSDASNDYNFAFDPDLEPAAGTNQEAAIVNLFYWNNIIHDIMYGYGFDEPGGNFQTNNYGNGGLGGDAVRADAQDGSGTNNANFATPSDGSPPRMQMFIWTPNAINFVTVNSPGAIVGNYNATGAAFGPAVDTTGITGDVEEVNDGTGTTTDGCEALVGFTSGRIALIDRGGCSFVQKVNNAQDAGAIAAIVVNNVPSGPITLGGTDAGVTIPSGMISTADGTTIRGELPGVNITFRNQGADTPPNRDSDFDNGVIIHEYGHGISNRLTGGPTVSGCLSTQEQMGEGWSDWYGLALTAEASDTADLARGIAPYLRYEPSTGAGIRRFPYSRDMAVNPDTFSTIGTGVSVPHGVGSVWAAITWDLYWDLVDEYGFNADFYGDWTTGGNNRAIQLVTDGLKLQGCLPGFEQGRDGILAADLALTGGQDRCIIWNAFARRGLGLSASSGNVNVLGDETEAFDAPPECLLESIFSDGFELGNTSAWDVTVTPP